MSLACEPNKPTPSYFIRKQQQTNRNLGLSPIFNVNTEVVACVENFVGPEYSCDNGMCKPTTGLTIGGDPPCLYNLNQVDTVSLTFDFTTGNTMYTGYTGEFCYSVLNSLPSTTILPVCLPYGSISGSSITRNFTINSDISTVDNTYRVRTWNKFTSKCLTDDNGNTGVTVDTSQYVDIDNDCYFVTVINPPKPILEFQPIDVLNDITFVNDTLSPVEGSNQILLNSNPIGGKIQLTVNGLNISQSDYMMDTTNSRLITLLNGNTFEEFDVVSASYNKSIGSSPSGVVDNVRLEFITVTGITTGITSSVSATTYENIVNYNDINNRLEVYLIDKIDGGVEPRVTINGVNLTYNVDFFKSNIVQNKLILNENTVIKVGDIISVYYYYSGINNPGDLGVLRSNRPKINWTTQQNVLKTIFSYGQFTVEVADRNDPSFNNILNSGTTIYNNTTTSYTLNVGPITTQSVKNYIYRVKFVKNFVTNNPLNVYTTETYSDTGSFRLDWSYINNTNF